MQAGFVEGTVIGRHVWAPGLITLKFEGDVPGFVAGQFVNVGLDLPATEQEPERFVRRSYSVAAAPNAPVELYLTEVEEGALTPHLFALQPGDRIGYDPKPLGFFTLQQLPDARDVWLVGTGTGLGPYISMLREGEVLRRFENVVIVHGVRLAEHLSYREEIEAAGEKVRYVPIVSREPEASGVLHGRVTSALLSGQLESHAGLGLDPEHSHLMLCGNPDMVVEMQKLLDERGLKKHRPRKPGHVTVEKYW